MTLYQATKASVKALQLILHNYSKNTYLELLISV